MKRMAVFVLACMLLLTACTKAPQNNDMMHGTEPEQPAETPAPGYAQDGEGWKYERIPLTRNEQTYGSGNLLIYPYVEDERYEDLNKAMYNRLLSGIGSVDEAVYTYFSVMCNQNGVLSVLFDYFSMEDSSLMYKVAFNYDMAEGKELFIEDCFDRENESWRSRIPDAVTKQAREREMTLLSDVMPVADGTGFYLTSNSLIVMYRPYEIATAAAGWPEFIIPHEELAGYYGTDSAVTRMMAGKGIQ